MAIPVCYVCLLTSASDADVNHKVGFTKSSTQCHQTKKGGLVPPIEVLIALTTIAAIVFGFSVIQLQAFVEPLATQSLGLMNPL